MPIGKKPVKRIKKRKHIIKRRAKVIKRKIKRFKLKKARSWLKRNITQHPIILGFICFIWISYLLRYLLNKSFSLKGFLLFNLLTILSWLVLVITVNLLKDIGPTKWYYRKKFVFSMLVLFFPFGLVFLWVGSRFKKISKIMLTVVFGALFLVSAIYPTLRYERFAQRSAIERISGMITNPKQRISLKRVTADILTNLKLKPAVKRRRAKLSPAEIALRCSSSVVSIKTKDKNNRDLGKGSGFIVSENGLILTNFHVLEGAHSAEVKFEDIVFENCKLIKGISCLDIALIKIEAKGLPALAIGDSDILESGQEVIVIGNPWGLEGSISDGLISAVRKKEDIKLIQMTAPVSMGSSGGPVINSYGEVIGITTLASLFAAQNLNFAIPINYLRHLIKSD